MLRLNALGFRVDLRPVGAALAWLWLGGLVVCSNSSAASPESAPTDWVYLDNGQVRLGVKRTSGACIGYFSLSGSTQNLLDHWDQGRFVQQSYYGRPDGTLWGKQPWRWNPVQGGDYQGHPAKLLELKVQPARLYARTEARHWSGCVALPEVVLEEWIQLTGKVAQVHFKMSYHGTNAHPSASQEIPALFAAPQLTTLVLYDGPKPWSDGALSRSQPGWPNESRTISEPWAAYVNTNDCGIGACVPIAHRLTCYRFGSSPDQKGACSYFAPLTEFAITPGMVFEYDLYLTAGKTDEMRRTFRQLLKR